MSVLITRQIHNHISQANQEKTDKVVADGGQTRHDGPQTHTGSHVVARSSPGEKHVLGCISINLIQFEVTRNLPKESVRGGNRRRGC